MKKLKIKAISRQKYLSLYGTPHEKMIKTLYPKIHFHKYIETYKNNFDETASSLFPKTKETLDYLSKKYNLAILTTKEKWKLERMIDYLKMRKYFGFIQTPADSEYAKPDPRAFDDILDHFNMKKSETIFIGDLELDRIAARQAKIKFIGIYGDFQKPVKKISSISELKKML